MYKICLIFIIFVTLQEEESVWTDYSKDEVVVKDQMAETILVSLIQDTADTFGKIYNKKQNENSC